MTASRCVELSIDELQSRIAGLFSQHLNLDLPSVETDLVKEGILDSLALVDLMLILNEEFGVTISFDEVEIDDFRSIARIAEFVIEHSAAMPGATLGMIGDARS